MGSIIYNTVILGIEPVPGTPATGSFNERQDGLNLGVFPGREPVFEGCVPGGTHPNFFD